MRVKNCCPSRVKRYKGLRFPRCHGKDACWACMGKYLETQKRGLRVVAS